MKRNCCAQPARCVIGLVYRWRYWDSRCVCHTEFEWRRRRRPIQHYNIKKAIYSTVNQTLIGRIECLFVFLIKERSTLLKSCSGVALEPCFLFIPLKAALELLWSCPGAALDLLWSCPGVALELLWSCPGVALELLWNCPVFLDLFLFLTSFLLLLFFCSLLLFFFLLDFILIPLCSVVAMRKRRLCRWFAYVDTSASYRSRPSLFASSWLSFIYSFIYWFTLFSFEMIIIMITLLDVAAFQNERQLQRIVFLCWPNHK